VYVAVCVDSTPGHTFVVNHADNTVGNAWHHHGQRLARRQGFIPT
jgi:hypothetical protein